MNTATRERNNKKEERGSTGIEGKQEHTKNTKRNTKTEKYRNRERETRKSSETGKQEEHRENRGIKEGTWKHRNIITQGSTRKTRRTRENKTKTHTKREHINIET